MKTLSQIIRKYWPVIIVVSLSLFLRLFNISSYMTFLGDEGRDSLVWLRMVNDGKLTLIGPQTSIGNMYLGPLFYYLMVPFFLVMGTVGPSVGTALFAGATTLLLWYCGKTWFNKEIGLLAAFLYAISPVAIILSHSSWNPNVMPFFGILTMLGTWKIWKENKFFWLPAVGITISFAIQSHYLAILLIPTVGIFWLLKLIALIRGKSGELKKYILFSILGVFLFLILTVLPLVWFDLRHNFINFKSFSKFFSERQTTVNLKLYKAIPQIWPLWQSLVTRLISGTNTTFGFLVSLVLGLFSLLVALRLFTNKTFSNLERPRIFFLLSWLIIGLLGMGLYKQHIYDHYFGFLFCAVFLLTALFLDIFRRIKFIGKYIFWTLLIIFTVFNIVNSPFKNPPGRQMQRTLEVSNKIILESGGRPFNLGMIAKQNYDAGYRYFLEKSKNKAVEIDAQRYKETVTEQLFVVCEISDCQPVGHAQAEIANFGWVKIDKVWDFPWGVKLFKLVHNK